VFADQFHTAAQQPAPAAPLRAGDPGAQGSIIDGPDKNMRAPRKIAALPPIPEFLRKSTLTG
jgi:hypothetical protein